MFPRSIAMSRVADPTRSGSDRAIAGRRPGLQEGAPLLSIPKGPFMSILAALTEPLEQHHEEISEVEIERQRTEQGPKENTGKP